MDETEVSGSSWALKRDPRRGCPLNKMPGRDFVNFGDVLIQYRPQAVHHTHSQTRCSSTHQTNKEESLVRTVVVHQSIPQRSCAEAGLSLMTLEGQHARSPEVGLVLSYRTRYSTATAVQLGSTPATVQARLGA